MLYKNNTQEQKLVRVVELSDAEMEKVSGGRHCGYIGFDPERGGYGGYDSYGGYGGAEQQNDGSWVLYGDYGDYDDFVNYSGS